MRPHVHFHSDSPFFSGSENMLATLLNDRAFTAEFRVTLGYRHSAAYEEGLWRRVHGDVEEIPLQLLDVPAVTDRIRRAPLRYVVKALFHLFGVKYLFVWLNTRRLTRVLMAERPDILHINDGGYPGTYSCLSAVLAARKAGVRHVVFVVNNIATPFTSFRRWLDRPIDRRVVAGVEVFVTGSRFARAAVRRVLCLPERCTLAIPNAIVPRPLTESREQTCRRLGVPDARPLVLQVANFERRKGQRYLLEALALLKRDGFEPLPFVVLEGDGPDEPAIRAAVAELGLAEDVSLPGREPHVFDAYAAADVIVVASVANEDFPNVILEAMSLGKPVVSTRIAGTPEQIVDGETGVIVPPGDAPALAAAIGALLAEPSVRARMGEAARERFERCFTAEKAVAAYMDLYRRLLGH